MGFAPEVVSEWALRAAADSASGVCCQPRVCTYNKLATTLAVLPDCYTTAATMGWTVWDTGGYGMDGLGYGRLRDVYSGVRAVTGMGTECMVWGTGRHKGRYRMCGLRYRQTGG